MRARSVLSAHRTGQMCARAADSLLIGDDRAALIQHFRTSKVQYLGLESYKMQVKRLLSKRPG